MWQILLACFHVWVPEINVFVSLASRIVTVVARDLDLDPFSTNTVGGTWLYFVLVPLGWIFL